MTRPITARARQLVARLPIRLKLAAAMILLLSGGSAITMIEVGRELEQEATRQAAQHAATLSDMIAYGLGASLVFEDSAGAQAVLNAAATAPDVAFITAETSSGTVRAAYRRGRDWSAHPVQRDSAFVYNNGQVIGRVDIGVSLEHVQQQVDQSRRFVLGVVAVMLLFGVLAALLLSSLILRPVHRLLGAVQRINAGDLSQRVGQTSQDEVGVLANAFNSMLERLELAYHDLREANRGLEERVEQRTAELREQMLELGRAQDALHDTEQRFRVMFESALVGVALFDGDGHLLESNPALTQMLGVPAIGRSEELSAFVHEESKSELTQLWRDLVRGRIDHFQREVRLVRTDGARVYVLTTVSRATSGSGRPEYIIVMAENISELKKLEERFRQTQRLESIGRLTGGIAHDFNNLLTAINGISDVALAERSPDDPVYHDLTEIRAAGERAAALTRQLLAFSRQQVLQPRVLCLNAVVGDIATMLRRLIGENIQLDLQLAPALPPVRADGGQMSQVIMNLVVNARDAMPAGGRLRIETGTIEITPADAERFGTTRTGLHVSLTVTDTGCGMDAATRARIFEPFFTTKKMGHATGLGLATVYGIIRQSDGGIAVDSVLGVGSSFTVVLPRTLEALEPTATTTVTPRSGTESLLVVEDEPAVRSLITRVLQRAGYAVASAHHGKDALRTIARDHLQVDLLITDVVMPEMGGPELVTTLRELHPALPVLYISGYSPDEVVQQGVTEQTAAFLQKPMSPAELTAKVRQILDQSPRLPAPVPSSLALVP